MTVAFIFPGQGSQKVGMGAALAAASAVARQTFEEVDDALGEKLSTLMFEGPDETLTLTANAQPAIMAASIATLRILEEEGHVSLPDKVAFVAGHSLGEYSALTAARSFALADTARLLRLRGDAMQQAVPAGAGAMAALLGVTGAEAEEFARQAALSTGETVSTANDNAPGQVVISGSRAAVEQAVALAKGARKKARMLSVSAPFHCALMAPAADAMAAAFSKVEVQAPTPPLVANVTAAPTSDPAAIIRQLVEQVTGLVRWRESVEEMARLGVTEMFEFGGKVLGPMVKRINPDIVTHAVLTPDDINAALRIL